MMRLPTLLFIFLMTLLFSCSQVVAFESSSDYNTANMAYPSNTTISQVIVFNSTMQAGGTIQFDVLTRNGGGRTANPDTANIKIEYYSASGSLKGSSETAYSANLPSGSYWSAGPGDIDQPFQQISLTSTNCGSAGSCANVAYMKISMIGTDGSFWAGNYGPGWLVPTVTFNGGSNLVYNPEFGVAPNGVMAQGWTASAGWGTCGTVSGSVTCVTNATGVTANMHGSGYDAAGGTTSGNAGGYTSTMSTTNPTPSTAPVPTNTITEGVSGGMTASQSSRKAAYIQRRDSYSDNHIYIEQVGNNNTINIEQSSPNNTVRGINQEAAKLYGDNNNIDIRQGANGANGRNLVQIETNGTANTIKMYQDRNDDGTQDASANANHVSTLNLVGDLNNITLIQRNNLTNTQGHYVEANILGSSNNVLSKQISDVGKTAFIDVTGNSNLVNLYQHDNAAHYADITLTGNGHSVNLEQTGTGAHKATVDLTNNGASSSVNILQQGTTSQSYSVIQSCVTSGCGVTVTQGQ